MTKTWKKAISQMVADYYRHAWNSPLTLEEEFNGMCKKYRGEATYSEMSAFFVNECRRLRDFYADEKTVAALMACNH